MSQVTTCAFHVLVSGHFCVFGPVHVCVHVHVIFYSGIVTRLVSSGIIIIFATVTAMIIHTYIIGFRGRMVGYGPEVKYETQIHLSYSVKN